jgi:hypothetical protein
MNSTSCGGWGIACISRNYNDSIHFQRDDRDVFNEDRKILAERALEKTMWLIAEPRGPTTTSVNSIFRGSLISRHSKRKGPP